ncbi:MerR family transcriptional regulator [Streptomyces bohaiensis]|uniref:MerR family transcriptional regulator n=1 Tax=Streptomyces bohaiensis TaxID=1431344 RepID=A0ABX1C869_9ACTN|nr:MerR family transcriptional regulator [Streptomyces bohaiensis]NJQ14283.1 MerR family transcriptional regulator [Streptomyces bohaiensis]
MRISELSRRSGVPIATIKYYIREKLLPAGNPTAHNQADYDERHLRRLRLIRALVSVRGLSVSAASDILAALSENEENTHLALGLVLGAMQAEERKKPPQEGEEVAAGPMAEAERLIDATGWQLHPLSTGRTQLARSLQSMAQVGLHLDWQTLLPYARLAEQTAVLDLDQLSAGGDDRLSLAERAVQVTVLLEPVLMILRRMAQESESFSRYGSPPGEEPPAGARPAAGEEPAAAPGETPGAA